MRGADVFCAPSLHGESFGVVLLEAMAAGAVVVASSLDGYRNVATHGVDALMTPPGDSDALGRALARALDDSRLRSGLVAAAEQRAQQFSMVRLAEAYIDRYQRLAG
jgi:phosphatidylinositol alpha-mannosyltransferase